MPEVIAGVVVEDKGRFLLVCEGTGSARGKWNLPAGHVEPGESLAAAAVRECEEETGYRVEIVRLLGRFRESVTGKEQHAFLARIVSGALRVSEEQLDVRWFSREDVEKLPLRNRWVTDAIAAEKK